MVDTASAAPPRRLSASDNDSEPLLQSHSPPGPAWQAEARGPSTGRTATLAMILATMFSFAVIGLFISTLGVILPHIQTHYGLSDSKASLVFLAGPSGYVFAARLNHGIHVKFGQRGIAAIGPLFQLVSAVLTGMHPPFAWLLLSIAVGGFGYGLLDGSWCAWAGAMDRANSISGLLHGAFSAGAGLGPLLCNQMLETRGVEWYHWFYALAAFSAIDMIVLPLAFRLEDSKKYREYEQQSPEQTEGSPALTIFAYRATWISAAYLLFDVGTESAISGWVVSFMLRVRHAPPTLSSLCSSGFWGGMAVGRVMLGFITDKIGLRRSITIYLVLAMILQLLFVWVEGWTASAILVSLVGFICGPLFPSCIVQLTQLLPSELHVSAVSYVASLGQIGGAVLPFALGTLSEWLGLRVFGVMIALQLAGCLFLWVLLTRPNKDESTKTHRLRV